MSNLDTQNFGDLFGERRASSSFNENGKICGLVWHRWHYVDQDAELLAQVADSLEWLSFHGTTASTTFFKAISSCPQLQELAFGLLELKESDLTHFSELPLERLNLSGCDQPEFLMRFLPNFSSLKTLTPGNNFDDSGVASSLPLNSLEELWLSNTNISDEGAARLIALRELKRLNLSSCPVSDRSVIPIVNT